MAHELRNSTARRAGTGGERSSLSYLHVLEQVTSSGITQAELGKAVGAAVRTVQTWAAGDNHPKGIKAQRLLDVQTIVSLLHDAYTDEGIKIWLHSRNRNLDMSRPIDLLTEGRIEEVLEEAQSVAGGM